MNLAQRYAGYSLDDLRDVERRIDRAKFPERYTALMAEIERREGPRIFVPREPEAEWISQARRQCRALLMVTCVGCAAFGGWDWWLHSHSALSSSASSSVRLDGGQGYVTPPQKALHSFLWLFWWPGLPRALALKMLLGRERKVEEGSQS